MKRSHLIAAAIAVTVTGWIVSGQFDAAESPRVAAAAK